MTPTAADLVNDLAKVADCDPATLPAILAQLSATDAAVAARMATLPAASAPTEPAIDRLLKVDDAATMLGMSTDWLYRSDAAKPFRVRVGTEVRYSLARIQRFIARQHDR